jgi:UDP-N-acetylglucosamine 4,6-dehydratase
MDKIFNALNNRIILITGGTGTFGKACVKYLKENHPNVKIRVFSRDEFKQAQLRYEWGSDGISYLLGDVRDLDRLRMAFHGVHYVIHAAALKHVSLGEYNPTEFIQTNISGTENVCRAAIDNKVSRVVFLASDKGVNPINLYGATKLVAEKTTIQHNSYSPSDKGTRFMTVRYGNVAGSRGSAIGIFRQAIDAGNTIPITDLRMTRFWMTIEDAVDLVMTAMEQGIRGGTFVPILRAFDVKDMVKAMLGKDELDKEDYKIIGMRPGEKLHEHLMTRDERECARWNGLLYVIPPQVHDWNGTELKKPWKKIEIPKYSSFHWPHRLSAEDLADMLPGISYE